MKNTFLVLVLFLSSINALGMGKSSNLPNFRTVVADQIYRGGQPSAKGLQMLAQMKVRTILDLRSEDMDRLRWEEEYVEKLGMRFISVPMSGMLSPSDRDMHYVERILQDPANYPIYVHCLHGKDRTGLVIGLHRVLEQNWSPEAAYDEMLALGFHKILFGLDRYFKERTGLEE